MIRKGEEKDIDSIMCAMVGMTLALTMASCHPVMPIDEKGEVMIVYYDESVGTDAIEKFIKKNDIKVIYQYSNIKGYALRLRDDEQRMALEKVEGVLSVNKDEVMRLNCTTE